jgi:hypothetical protein
MPTEQPATELMPTELMNDVMAQLLGTAAHDIGDSYESALMVGNICGSGCGSDLSDAS